MNKPHRLVKRDSERLKRDLLGIEFISDRILLVLSSGRTHISELEYIAFSRSVPLILKDMLSNPIVLHSMFGVLDSKIGYHQADQAIRDIIISFIFLCPNHQHGKLAPDGRQGPSGRSQLPGEEPQKGVARATVPASGGTTDTDLAASDDHTTDTDLAGGADHQMTCAGPRRQGGWRNHLMGSSSPQSNDFGVLR